MPDKAVIDQIISKILEVITPDKIILFGSRARGDAKSDSDFDILVIKQGIESELSVEQSIYRNLYNVNASVDIIVKTPETIEKSKKRFISIVKEALEEGIIVYE